MNRRDLEQEIQQAFDGDPEKADALRKTLLEDPAALDLWCDYALMESELRRHVAGRAKVPAKRRKAPPVWLLASVAVLVLSAGWLMFRGGEKRAATATLTASPESIVRDAAGDLFEGGDFPLGTPLSVVRGVVKIELPGDTRSVIEGPATITLVSLERMELAGGLAWVGHTPGEKRFTVKSAGLEVTGGKSEFGIDLREDRPAAVHAFLGEVEARSLSGTRDTITLEAGDAATILPGGTWQRKPAERRDFLDRLPAALPMIHLTFDRLENNILEIGGSGLGSAGAVALLHHPQGARLVPGVKGMALEMDGTGSWIATNWTGISGKAPRTVSLWCRLPAGRKVEKAPPFALWGDPTPGWNRKFKVAPVTADDGRVVLRASFGEYYANGTRGIADGKWHHLAVVFRGTDAKGEPLLEFHVDGERDRVAVIGTSGGIHTETELGDARGLSIGRYELTAAGANPYFIGAIDDLRIHAGALDAREIRGLAERP